MSDALLTRPRLVAPLLLLAAVVLSAAFADRALPPNDEGMQLTNAARLLRGAVYYRDLDGFQFPGGTFLLAGALRVGGESVLVGRVLAAAIYCAALLALYAAALAVLDRARAALFGAALLAWKVLAWPATSAYFYSDLAFAASALAAALFLGRAGPGGRGRIAAAGLCAGVACTAKQNLGLYVLLALAAALVLERRPGSWRRELAALAGGFALPVGALFALFAVQGVLAAALWSGLVRPFTAYWPGAVAFHEPLRWWAFGGLSGLPGHPYLPGVAVMLLDLRDPAGSGWRAAELFARLLYSSVPLAFGWALWRAARGAPTDPRLRALAVLAGAAALSAFPRADYFHVIGVYPLVALLLLALGAASGDRAARRPPRLLGAAVLALLLGSGALARAHLARFTHPLGLPRAELRISPHAAFVEPITRHVVAAVPPGDPFFVYGHEAYYYFFADRYSPWRFAQLYPGQDGDDGGRALVRVLDADPPRVIVRGAVGHPSLRTTTPELFRFVAARYEPAPGVFPGAPPPPSLVSVFRPRPDAPSGGESP